MSRLRLPFSLLAAIALAIALVACGDSGGSSDENPQTVLDSATLQGIDSGNVDLSVKVKAKGKEGGNLNLSVSGPFQSEGEGAFPQLAMTAKASGQADGEDIDFDGGLVLLPNSGYVTYEGVDYEIDPTTFSFVKSAIQRAQQQNGGGGSGGAAACQGVVAEKLKVAEFLDNPSNEGSADVGGTETTKVSGDLDVSGALDSLVGLSEDPACRSQVDSVGVLPSKSEVNDAKDEVKGAVKVAHAEVYVGDDDIIRRVAAQVTIEPKGDGSGPSKVEVDLDLKLTEVNEEQEISGPSKAKPLSDLFIKLGVNPIELLGLLEGEGEGLENLFEGLRGGNGGSTRGSDNSSGSGSGGGQQAYLECLRNARSQSDLQKCGSQSS